jgi:segregation and condensation protein A
MSEITYDTYKAELEGIKAPLGVILYLIRRDNVDVYDIPIAKITKDYLGYLDLMVEHRIDLAGEFFVLAATLMRIKAQMLLRRDEGEEDPREELVRNLLEYKKMVEAARSFKELEAERYNVFQRPVPLDEKEFREETVLELNLFEVMKAFREVMTEFEATDTTEIEPEQFTIEEKIELIGERIQREGQVRFVELFSGSSSRLELIVTFIAMLELMKRNLITARQETSFGEIWIYESQPPPAEEDTESTHWSEADTHEVVEAVVAPPDGVDTDSSGNGNKDGATESGEQRPDGNDEAQ